MKRVKKGDKVKVQFSDGNLSLLLYHDKNGKIGTVTKVVRPISSKGFPFLYKIEMENGEIIRLLRDEFVICK